MDKSTLMTLVENFVRSAGLLEDLEAFQKGALVAQNPFSFQSLTELDDADRACLQDEIDRKWHHPKDMWITVVVCSIGAAVQGWDQVRLLRSSSSCSL